MSFMEPKTRNIKFMLEGSCADPMHIIKVVEMYPDKTWTSWSGWRMRLLTWLVVRWIGKVDERRERYPFEVSEL